MKKSVFLFMAAAVLAGCSDSEKTEIDDNVDLPIMLKSNVTNMDISTRTPVMSNPTADNPFEALVLATNVSESYDPLYAEGTMIFKGAANGVAYEQMRNGTRTYPGLAPVYMVGVHPSDFVVTNGKATLTITGKEDVMYAAQVQSTKTKAQAQEYATLDFAHQLTKLELRVRADGQSAINNFGTVKKIELVKANDAAVKTDAIIDLSTGALTWGATTNNLPCYEMSVTDEVVTYSNGAHKEHVLTLDPTYLAYVMAPPVIASNTVGANEYAFRITYDKGVGNEMQIIPVDLKKADGGLYTNTTKGYSFLITFQFSSSDIYAVATIQDWKTGGESVIIIDENE